MIIAQVWGKQMKDSWWGVLTCLGVLKEQVLCIDMTAWKIFGSQ